MSNPFDVAAKFFAAIEAGDIDAVRAIYAPDATIWHNNDGITQNRETNLKTLTWIARTLTNRHYDVSRLVATPTGFAQEHVMRATLPNGEAFAMPAAIFCDVENGQITVLREYLDTASAAPLLAFAKA